MTRQYGEQTRSFAKLTVTRETYEEISKKLLAAGYHHVFHGNNMIDMTGIALVIGSEDEND